MNWISQIFFAVIITALIGDVLLGMWWLFQLAFMRWNPALVYNTLRWIVVLFLLPVGFIALKVGYRSDFVVAPDSMIQMTFSLNEQMMFYLKIIAVIWLMVAIAIIVWNVRKESNLYKRNVYNVEVTDPVMLEELKRLCAVLGIKRKVTVFQNPEVYIPYTNGYFRKIVVFPCKKYSKAEITMVLCHELMHVKKHDLFFKVLGRFVQAIQPFNPLVYLLNGLIDKWSECDCDAKALKVIEDEHTPKQYYNVLWDMISEECNRRELASLSMLVENQNSIEGRIEYMVKLKNAGKVSKLATTLLLTAFVLLSTSTAYAAGTAMAKISDKVYESTEVIEVVSIKDNSENAQSEQFIVTAEESADVPTVYMESDVMPLGAGNFDWNVPAGTRYVTGQIYLSKGDEISVACNAKPTSSTYWVGIVLPNGNSKVVQGSGSNGDEFEITSSGYYRVMVQNLSSVEIQAVGSYLY